MDKLEMLRVRSERVLVGELELTLKTSTLMQQKSLMVSLGKIDPGPVFAAFKPVIDKAGSSEFVAAIIAAGPGIYKTVMEFASTAGGDALAEAAAAVLDNEANFKALRDTEKVLTDEDRTVEGRRYVLSDGLREWVAATITPRQAFHVLATAVKLNDYGALGEALAALARTAGAAIGSTQPATSSSVESPSSEGLQS